MKKIDLIFKSLFSGIMKFTKYFNSVLIIALFNFTIATTAHAQELVWAKSAGGLNSDRAKGIAADTYGNSYVTGNFSGSATFGKGEANETILTASGDDIFFASEVFIAKYDPIGNLIWAKSAGGPLFERANAIAADEYGNSYVTGTFSGTATFGKGEANETNLIASGGANIFIAKYNPSGNLVWAREVGSSSSNVGKALAVDAYGNSYVTGSFHFTATFGLGEVNETILTSSGQEDVFIAKYDPNGNLIWAKCAGGPLYEWANAIAADEYGNSYISGTFASPSVILGMGEANETTLTNVGGDDIFIAKYDPSGNLIWAKSAGGSQAFDQGRGIDIDASGNSYITGVFRAPSATFGAGEANETTLTGDGSVNVFISKYNPDGILIWATGVRNLAGEGNAIAIDNDGNSYVTGVFVTSAIFGLGEANETTLVSSESEVINETDIFVAKYDTNGYLLWAKNADGPAPDNAYGITNDSHGNTYVTGSFQAPSANFGMSGSSEITLTSSGGSDIFVTKIEEDVTEKLSVTGPEHPQEIGTAISLVITFDSDNSVNVNVQWNDGTSGDYDASGGTVVADHTYITPGVYSVSVTVTDVSGLTDVKEFNYVVIYDPTNGFVTGGGWTDSPEGASIQYPDAIGKANFGFVSKYKKGATVPTGNTEFQFKAGNLNFNSYVYDWLVIAGSKAMFKGEGTINNSGTYGFMISAIDGDKKDEPDKFRIKIWDKSEEGELIVYDNQPGSLDDSDPVTVLGGGSITIHDGKGNNARVADAGNSIKELSDFNEISIYPNPVREIVTIEFPTDISQNDENIELHLFNLIGVDMMNDHMRTVAGRRLELDILDLPAGIYILTIPFGDSSVKHKITKQ